MMQLVARASNYHGLCFISQRGNFEFIRLVVFFFKYVAGLVYFYHRAAWILLYNSILTKAKTQPQDKAQS